MNFNQKMAIAFLIASLILFLGSIVSVITFVTGHASTSLYGTIIGFVAGIFFVCLAVLANNRGIRSKQ